MNEPDLKNNESGLKRHEFEKFVREQERFRKRFFISLAITLPLIFLIIFLNVTMSNVRYQQINVGMLAIFWHENGRAVESYWSQYEFEDIMVAAATFPGVGIDSQYFQEIVRFEKDSYIYIFSPGYVFGPGLNSRIPTAFSFLFIERENGMLSPVDIWRHGIESHIGEITGIWHHEDRIARDVVKAHVQGPVSSRVNGGVPIFYGVGVGPPPEHIFILGLEPDEIIPFEFRGDQYFFWYYLSTPHFGEILAENIDISEAFRLADIVELFDIRVIR